MKKFKSGKEEENRDLNQQIVKPNDTKHIGSSNAFEETENPLSRDSDNISDERLDELLEE
jgi:hypothetical protein